MPQSPRQRRDGRALRQRAEASVQAEVSSAEEVRDPATRPETLRLLHELQVHQVELEMQNEELRRSHAEMDALQERYRNLYDLSLIHI